MQDLVRLDYPTVDRSRLVQDNWHTHTPGSFYQGLPPDEALKLAQQCEIHSTPKNGRWLKMAEIELAALSVQCLDRRIPDQGTLEADALAWSHTRNQAHTTVNWQFTKHAAREKLHGKYPVLAN